MKYNQEKIELHVPFSEVPFLQTFSSGLKLYNSVIHSLQCAAAVEGVC